MKHRDSVCSRIFTLPCAAALTINSSRRSTAELRISLGADELLKTPLRALDDNPEGSFWQQTRDSVSLWFE
jgi:hypothetical protein